MNKNDSLIDITDEYNKDSNDNKESLDSNSTKSDTEEKSNNESNPSKNTSTSKDNKKEGTYKVTENTDKGTYEVIFNNKTVVKDLKECIGEMGKYLIFPKIGEDNIPDSEILDWDIAFVHKQTGKVTILEDALYLNDPYEVESNQFAILDNTFYGVIENGNKLFKVDLTKDTITKTIIKNSPELKSIAGFYIETDLLFIIDSKGDILSYNDKTKDFTKHTYKVKSNSNVLHFSEIYDTDEFTKDFKFVFDSDKGSLLLLYLNRYEENEDCVFYQYNANEGNFYLLE